MKFLFGITLTVVLLVALVIPAFAVHGGGIIVGNEVVLRIRHDNSGMTIQQRADEVTVRLNKVLGCACLNPGNIKVKQSGGDVVIMHEKDLIVTVDKATAMDNGMSPMQLANIWAKNLRRVLPQAKAENCGISCEL